MFKRGAASTVGLPFYHDFWGAVLLPNTALSLPDDEHSEKAKEGLRKSFESRKIRFWMDLIVNGIIRDLVTYCTPLVLARAEDEMTFISNCMAFAFLPTIDDLADPQDIVITWPKQESTQVHTHED